MQWLVECSEVFWCLYVLKAHFYMYCCLITVRCIILSLTITKESEVGFTECKQVRDIGVGASFVLM